MVDASVPGYHAFWTNKRKMLKVEYQKLVRQYSDAEAQPKQLFKVLCDIEDTAGYNPASMEESHDWASIVNTVEENHAHYCKALSGKMLHSALYGTSYTATLNELMGLLKEGIFSEENKTTKDTGEPNRRKVSMKFLRDRQNC
jgi:hypothetical protein